MQPFVFGQLVNLLDTDHNRVQDTRHLHPGESHKLKDHPTIGQEGDLSVFVDEHQRIRNVVIAKMDDTRSHPASGLDVSSLLDWSRPKKRLMICEPVTN